MVTHIPSWLKVAISCLLVIFFLMVSDSGLQEQVAELASSWWAAATVFCLCLQNISAGVRWWAVLRFLHQRLTSLQAVYVTLVGTFYANVLPSGLGLEAYRVLSAKSFGISVRQATASIALEKLVGLAPLVLVFFLLSAPLLAEEHVDTAFLLGPVALLMAILVGATLLAGAFKPFSEYKTRLSELLSKRFNKSYWPALVATSVISGSLLILALTLSWIATIDEAPSWSQVALFPIVIVVSSLPVSVGGWGLREGALISLYAGSSLSFDQALGIGLSFGILQWVASLPGLLCHIPLKRLDPKIEFPQK